MIEDLAARQRAEALAATKRRSQRQNDAAFWDGQGASNSGGSIPAMTGSNGLLRLGQSVPLMQGGGSAQIDTFSTARTDELLIPIAKGNVKICLQVTLENEIQYWVGGDRRTSKHVVSVVAPEVAIESNFEATGPTQSDWIFALKTLGPNGFRVRSFLGDGTIFDSGPDNKTAPLSYKGGRYWSSPALGPNYESQGRSSVTSYGSSYGYGSFTVVGTPGNRGYSAQMPSGPGELYGRTDVMSRDLLDLNPYRDYFEFDLQVNSTGAHHTDSSYDGTDLASTIENNLIGGATFTSGPAVFSDNFSGTISESISSKGFCVTFFETFEINSSGTDEATRSEARSGSYLGNLGYFSFYFGNLSGTGTFVEFVAGNRPPPETGTQILSCQAQGTLIPPTDGTSFVTAQTHVGQIPVPIKLALSKTNQVNFSSTLTTQLSGGYSYVTTVASSESYESLRVFDFGQGALYKKVSRTGFPAEIKDISGGLVNTSPIPDTNQTQFFLEYGAIAREIQTPPDGELKSYAWIRQAEALTLYRIDLDQCYETDTQGLYFKPLKKRTKVKVDVTALDGSTFVQREAQLDAIASKITIPGSTSSNTIVLGAYFCPKST
jgi:hypothetical protein